MRHGLWWPGSEECVLPVVHKAGDGAFCFAECAETLDFSPKVEGLELDLETADEQFLLDAAGLLAMAWPEMHAQALGFLTRVYPVRYASGRRWETGGSYGTRSSNIAHMGQVYATTDTPFGFLEGIVASLGNWKLYDAGVTLTSWQQASPIFTNADSAIARMALRDERHAPLGTALHATYAAAHMTALYVGLARVTESTLAKARLLLCRERLQRGWAALHATLTPARNDGWVLHFDAVVADLLNDD